MDCQGPGSVVFDRSLTEYDFGPGHPMSPLRVDLTIRLAEDLGLFENLLRLVPAPIAEDDLIAKVHSSTLIEAVTKVGTVPGTVDLEHLQGVAVHLDLEGREHGSVDEAQAMGAALTEVDAPEAVGVTVEQGAVGHRLGVAGDGAEEGSAAILDVVAVVVGQDEHAVDTVDARDGAAAVAAAVDHKGPHEPAQVRRSCRRPVVLRHPESVYP